MKLYGEKNNTLIMDFGYVTKRTSPVSLDPTKNYRMVITIHVPTNLTREYHYMTQFNIYGLKSNAKRDVSGTATQTPGATFAIEIVPTLSYYINGMVYDPDGNPAKDAKVTVINERTQEKLVVKTSAGGNFTCNLADMKGGYTDGDKITVKAEKGKAKGENYTLVDIPPEGYTEDEFSSSVDVYLKKPKEEGLPMEYILGGLVAVIIVAVIAAVLIRKRKGKERGEEKRELEKEEGEKK